MPVSINLIKQFPLFLGLPETEQLNLAQHAQLGSAKQGQAILQRGAVVSFLTFVLSGRIQSNEISDDGRVIGITVLIPGDIIGCLTLADDQPSTNTLVTLEDCQLMLVPMAIAKQLMLSQPAFALSIIRLLAQSVRHSYKERAMLSLPNAFHRIFVQLNLLANNPATQRQVHHFPRQQDIAAMVNTSRETVSRALQVLIKNGILTKEGHQLQVQQSDLLQKLAIDGLDALEDQKVALQNSQS
jgi:CRP-like cAMP-binding protein